MDTQNLRPKFQSIVLNYPQSWRSNITPTYTPSITALQSVPHEQHKIGHIQFIEDFWSKNSILASKLISTTSTLLNHHNYFFPRHKEEYGNLIGLYGSIGKLCYMVGTNLFDPKKYKILSKK